jgi:hypothetical protein
MTVLLLLEAGRFVILGAILSLRMLHQHHHLFIYKERAFELNEVNVVPMLYDKPLFFVFVTVVRME